MLAAARAALLARCLVVVLKPPAGARDGLLERRELEVWVEALELRIGGGLLVLAVALLRVELDRAGEVHAAHHRHGRVLDGHLRLLRHREDDRLDGVVRAQHLQGMVSIAIVSTSASSAAQHAAAE